MTVFTSITKKAVFFYVTMISLILFLNQYGYSQVIVKEDSITIPTYVAGKPDPMPRFYEHANHQGVQRRMYPYPFDDNLTNNKQDKKYFILDISNEYIDIGIMPEIGGRIFYAYDKSNGYDWIYRQHVIKPTLIGMEGWWISGGLAWGFPHHHGPNICKPLNYKIIYNPDSSVTVWFDNIDELARMRALVGYTIYPNSSRINMSVKLWNRTEITNSFLFWTVPAVHADTNYQVIFPPSVQYITFHGKTWMTTWPIADGIFNNYDFKGIDISLWKNTFIPSSFFAWDEKEDYFGGYNYGKKAGTVWVGNHYTEPGMKYWADGNNPAGRAINSRLTDDDGQYIEQMSGMFTDNQPDYSWIQPYEYKSESMNWFPIKDLEGLKYANSNGALNYELSNKSLVLRVNTTSPFTGAKIRVKDKGEILFEKVININPKYPFNIDIPVKSGLKEDDLDFALHDRNGNILLSYKPSEHHPPDYPKPEPNKHLPAPSEIKTAEELYFDGLWLYQFHSINDPMPYFEEALKRDPGNYKVNTQLGIMNIQDFKWDEAEKHLRTAVSRATLHYMRPRDCEATYYLGIVLKEKGEIDSAYDCFYNAIWDYAWQSAGYYKLAEIDCLRGNLEKALDHINRSLSTNINNEEAINLKTILFRKLNYIDAAKELALNSLKSDCLNREALNELTVLYSIDKNKNEAEKYANEFTRIMRDDPQAYIEIAAYYGQSGFYKDAIDILSRLENKGNTFPMLYYYLGYYWSKVGDQAKALNYYKSAGENPYLYCFPFRSGSINVLKSATNINPKDAKAPYYLGNLLYEHQPEYAIKEWEKSSQLDNSFYIVHRNLGLAYKEVKQDYAKALASYKKAVACNADNPRLLYEMDQLNELNKVSPQKQYEFLKENIQTTKKRSETILRMATRAVGYGKYTEALEILKNNFIEESEGARERQDTYINAHTLRAIEYYKKSKFDNALADLDSALAYPIGLYGRSLYAQLYYLEGVVYQKMGEEKKAEEMFKKTLETGIEGRGFDRQYLYYHGLALQRLSKEKEAKKLFENMLKDAQDRSGAGMYTGQFGGRNTLQTIMANNHYLTGLAYEGLGEKDKAMKEFEQALDINPGHVWSRQHLSEL
jgi:tetratricopeptide (TPR) repeat protein